MLCGFQRGGLTDIECECDTLVDGFGDAEFIRILFNRLRAVTEARNEACDLLYVYGLSEKYQDVNVELRETVERLSAVGKESP